MEDQTTSIAASSNSNTLAFVGLGVAALILFKKKDDGLTDTDFANDANPYAQMTEQQHLRNEPDAAKEPQKFEKWVQAAGIVWKTVERLFGPGGPFHKAKPNAAQNEFILGTVNNQFGFRFNSSTSPWSTGQFGAFQFGNFGGGFGNNIPGGQFGNTTFPSGGFNPFAGFGFP